ncbi:MAG: hypothetical protein P8184_20410 [Calditrichia bacterium]
MSRFLWLLFLAGLIALFSCQPRVTKKEAAKIPVTEPQPSLMSLPDSVVVQADSENVRKFPNGRIFEKLYRNEVIYPQERVGNWIKFHSFYIDSGYVWAPSIGLKRINLYRPGIYFDSTYQAFYAVQYFKKFFHSPGKIVKKSPAGYELFFSHIGLGSHEEVVYNVTQRSTQEVQHGVTLYIRNQDSTSQSLGYIYQVKVDFYTSVEGIKNALQKCGLPDKSLSGQNESKVWWNPGRLRPGLEVSLERKELKSDAFSSVWYRGGE